MTARSAEESPRPDYAPSPPAPFKHYPIYSRSHLRLMQVTGIQKIGNIEYLTCNLEHFAINHDPKYNALSYEWRAEGDAAWVDILVNGALFKITHNLHDYLKSMIAGGMMHNHRRGLPWLWADQICIRQSDVSEKAKQIQLMPTIYRKAQSVIIWLGLGKVEEHFHGHFSGHGQEPHCDGDAYMHCTCSMYWTRLWIMQEVTLAQNLYLLIGDELQDWCTFTQNFTKATEKLPVDHVVRKRGERIHNLNHLRDVCGASGRSGYTWTGVMPILAAAGCADIRDKVYGFQGLIDSRVNMPIDYNVGVEVIVDRLIRREFKMKKGKVLEEPLPADEHFDCFIRDVLAVFLPGSQMDQIGTLPSSLQYLCGNT